MKRYVEKWKLKNVTPFTKTMMGDFYIADSNHGRVILKVFTDLGRRDGIVGSNVLRSLNSEVCVKIFELDENAVLLEYADGKETLTNMVKNGDDDTATEIISDILLRIHIKDVNIPEHVISLEKRFSPIINLKSTLKGTSLFDLFSFARENALFLINSQKESYLLHGDINHQNIVKSKRGWLALDPKGYIGERCFDAANFLCNPCDLPHIVQNKERLMRQARIVSRKLDLDINRLLKWTFVEAAVIGLWELSNNHNEKSFLDFAKVMFDIIRKQSLM